VRLRGLLKGCCRADEVPAIFHSLVPGYVCDQDLATGHPTSAEIYLGATATLLSVTAFCVPREEYGEKQP